MIYRYSHRLLLAIGVIFTAITAASAQNNYALSVRPFLPATAGFLDVSLRISNNSTVALELGDSRIALNANVAALNLAAISKLREGPWDDANLDQAGVSRYLDLAVTGDATTGDIFIDITRNPAAAGGYQLQPNSSDSIIIRIPIRAGQCNNNHNLTLVRGQSTYFSNWTGTDITTFFTLPPFIPNATLKPNRPSPVLTLSPLPTNKRQSYCATGNLTLTVAYPGSTIDSILVFRRQSFDPAVRVRRQQGSAPITLTNLGALGFQNNDSLFVLVYDGRCYYRSNGFVLKLDPPAAAPTLTSPLPPICLTSLSSQPTRTYNFGASDFDTLEVTVTPANAVTNNGGPSIFVNLANGASELIIRWNPAFPGGTAIIRARTRNACGLSPEAVASIRLFAGPPAKPTTRPGPGLNRTITGPVCINDTSLLSVFRVTGDVNALSYELAVNPPAAIRDPGGITPYLSSSSTIDSLLFRVKWNRFYQGDSAYVKYRAINTCGESPYSDSLLIRFNRLPVKPTYPQSVDSTCQRTDSTLFSTTNATPNRVDTTVGYVWFVAPENALNAGRFTPAGNPQPTLSPTNSYQTKNGQVYIKWNPNFYGWVRVSVAANSRGCKFLPPNDPYDTYYTFPGVPPAPNGLGDTVSRLFFVRPLPLRSTRPFGERAFCASDTNALAGILDSVRVPRSLYTTGVRFIVSDSLRRLRNQLVTFIPSDSLGTNADTVTARFRFNNRSRPGVYLIRVVSYNECGRGDTSQALRIRISTVPVRTPLPTDTIAQVTPALRAGNSREQRFSICSGSPTTITYRVSIPDVAYYRWEVQPTTAGTVQPVVAGGSVDSSVVRIAYNPTYVGQVTLRVFPINGCNRNNPAAQLAASIAQQLNLYPTPTAQAGAGVAQVPVGARTRLGGAGSTNIPGLPAGNTASGGNGTSYQYIWTVSPTPPAAPSPFVNSTTGVRGNVANDPNPWFDPTIANNGYTVTLRVVDLTTGCVSQPSTIALDYRPSLAVNGKAILQGAYNSALPAPRRMRTSLASAGLLNIYNRPRVSNQLAGYVNPGYTVPTGANAPVDLVRVQLRKVATNPVNPDGLGLAWIMPDGSFRDFYTGSRTHILVGLRLNSTGDGGTVVKGEAVFPVILHRGNTIQRLDPTNPTGPAIDSVIPGNHLAITTASPVVMLPQDTTIPSGPGRGYFDLTVPSNVFGYNIRGYGVSARIGADGTMIIGGQVDNIGPYKPEISTPDHRRLMQAPQSATQLIYSFLDVNLDGIVNQADVDFVEDNANSLLYSTLPQSAP